MFDAGAIWESGQAGQIEIFEYPSGGEAPPSALEDLFADNPTAPPPAESIPGLAAEQIRLDYEKRLGEETRRAFEAGRQQGRKEEQEQHAAALRVLEEQRSRQATALLAGFERERDRYLAAVEGEVVKLALAIAARILRREAQMDPLLLTGAVRVALGQLSASTAVRLRVPAVDASLWQEAIAHLPNLALRPEVVAAESLHPGECVLETSLGSVDLGLRAQLAEIERGFFDRAPGAALARMQPPAETAP